MMTSRKCQLACSILGVITISLFVSCSSDPTGPEPEPTVHDITESAWSNFERENYHTAYNEFSRAIEADSSYADAYLQAVGINPHETSAEECRLCTIERGIEQPVGLQDDVDAWLDWLLIERVMPSFKTDGFTYIYDYPQSQAALAKLHQDRDGHTVAARFELFYGETELANGFDELLDANEQRQRFERENIERQRRGLKPSLIDESLLKAVEHGLPNCSGVALGLDRMLILLSGADTMEQVLAFPLGKI